MVIRLVAFNIVAIDKTPVVRYFETSQDMLV